MYFIKDVVRGNKLAWKSSAFWGCLLNAEPSSNFAALEMYDIFSEGNVLDLG